MPGPWKVLRKRLLSEYIHESVNKGFEAEVGQEKRAVEESNLQSYSISTTLHPTLTPKVFRRLHGKKGKTETVTLFCRLGQRSFLGMWQWGKCLQWRISRFACCWAPKVTDEKEDHASFCWCPQETAPWHLACFSDALPSRWPCHFVSFEPQWLSPQHKTEWMKPNALLSFSALWSWQPMHTFFPFLLNLDPEPLPQWSCCWKPYSAWHLKSALWLLILSAQAHS